MTIEKPRGEDVTKSSPTLFVCTGSAGKKLPGASFKMSLTLVNLIIQRKKIHD